MREVLRHLNLAERDGNTLFHMGHMCLNGEIDQLIGATRDFGVQVLGIKKMHRDPFFRINPLTNAFVFFFVCHVCSLFRVVKEKSGQESQLERSGIALTRQVNPSWSMPRLLNFMNALEVLSTDINTTDVVFLL